MNLVVGTQDLHAREHAQQPILIAGPLVDGAQDVEDPQQHVSLGRGFEDPRIDRRLLANRALV